MIAASRLGMAGKFGYERSVGPECRSARLSNQQE